MKSSPSFSVFLAEKVGVVLSRMAVALLFFAVTAVFVHAQGVNSTFTGTVTDAQGAAVAGADVTIINIGTNDKTLVKTNAEGVYRVPELPVGTYEIDAEAKGFKKIVRSGLKLDVGTIQRVDFKLEIGQTTETVVVEAGTLQVQTEDSRLTQIVGATQIANLPLNGRNVFDLITLAPGAADATGVSFENGHSTVVNGLRPNFTGFLINGSANKGLSGGVVTTPNADIVQEFQMLTLNMSAQYGNSSSAIVNVVTKSGTNELHGTAFGFWRDDSMDATDTFINQAGGKNPELRYGQFGGTVTGPIIKNKLFFTASYQGDRYLASQPPTNILTESPEWRAAVASAFPDSVANRIYSDFPASAGNPSSPLSLNLSSYVSGNNGGSGSGFGSFADYMCAGNYPAGFTQLATKFQHLFGVLPTDNFSGCSTGAPALQAGIITDRNMPFLNENTLVFGSQTSSNGNLFNGNGWSTRIDWMPGQKDHIFGEYYWLHTSDKYGALNAGSNIHGFTNPTANHLPNFQVSWVHTFSPNWVNEARAGYVLK